MRLNNTNEALEKIAARILSNQATEDEIEKFNQWYAGFDDTEVPIITEDSREALKKKLLAGINQRIIDSKPSNRPAWRSFKVAASIALILSFAPLLYIIYTQLVNNPNDSNQVTYITKTAEAGQKKLIKLPDGTTVKLNATSSLQFPKTFVNNTRSVKLKGEAFFDVVRNADHPFIVELDGGEVEVLGTSFNVKAYPKEQNIEVAVRSGRVKVSDPSAKTMIVLDQDELTQYRPGNNEMMKAMIKNHDKIFGWQEGKLVFHDQDLPIILSSISRWYGVTFELGPTINTSKKINANFDQASLREVMECLSHNYGFKFSINENNVTIK